uniref:Hsp70-interacting protein N-terminal domain-containing protein n=1 Tax=Phallusia mammillata TaxID=59560 RepID=A0A6F9DUS3_9ASCI|nr:putative protein FAM10A4 [Phallusia mammillata]
MENLGITEDKLEMLKQFVILCKMQPAVIHMEEFKFLKDWLVNDLKAAIPDPPSTSEKKNNQGDGESSKPAWTKPESSDEESESMDEDGDDDSSDLDIDMEGVISGDTDAPQEMGDDAKQSTEDEQDKAMDMRRLGMEAMQNGDNEGAIKHFTAGILLDNKKTVLFVKRATAYLRMSKPNAATRDATKALNINPDSAAAYKVLGKANKLLGNWDEASHDFEVAQKIDFDEEIYELLKEIKPKATKIREHKMVRERKKKEREVAERIKRVKKAQKAQEKARKEQEKRDKEFQENMKKGMPFNFQDMPDMSGFNFGKGAPEPPKENADEKPSKSKEEEPDQNGEPKLFEVPTDIDLD